MPTPTPTSIRCPHSGCGALNPPGARFCRQCGNPLQEKPQPHPDPPQPKPQPGPNVMDRYPNYKFRPTKMYDWRRPKFGRFLRIIFSLFSAVIFFFSCLAFFSTYNCSQEHSGTSWFDEVETRPSFEVARILPLSESSFVSESEDRDYNERLAEAYDRSLRYYQEKCLTMGAVYFALGATIWFLFAFLPFRGCGLPKTKLTDLADYIQRYHYTGMFRRKRTPKYVFFVKDNRFGVMDVAHYRIALEAGYARLEWREKNRLLYAYTNGGQKVTIDLKGNILK